MFMILSGTSYICVPVPACACVVSPIRRLSYFFLNWEPITRGNQSVISVTAHLIKCFFYIFFANRVAEQGKSAAVSIITSTDLIYLLKVH